MSMTRRTMMRGAAQGALAAVLVLGLGSMGLPGMVRAAVPAGGPAVEVWKAASCECCEGWVRHMRAAGFEVTVHTVDDVTPMKRMAGVPDDLASCHTARVGGYVLEGHVPADDVRRLLAERPQARGLAVPGMPQDAPGMDMGVGQPYQVMLFGGAGGPQVFARH
ncbi:DUF411 domain-containing protein (plasmid) [Azospirillum oryzae]|uniref:DUF411 domain-containing protein n=1 Tax=Azospirillum oryzae TaxID=286727 RepID=A0A6N1AL03_9PROT|nr:DUF411 domain-containing protein [Azospirillum oryzae]KAA0586736.1 DUF411 domain-containing protein [Azospirillum oryzae]QKS48962.1 DUF411 domain-containing protein [Azospirillum oryzae]GLR83216.1 metal-binding protein [Azospirillum oryzae]